MAKKQKAKVKPRANHGVESEPPKEATVATELGRLAKLFALYLMKDLKDEAKKVNSLNAAGFSAPEIAALLDKKVSNVYVQISQAKKARKE